jgi:hypothetical protein
MSPAPDHPYNNPTLGPIEFLEAIRHDPRVPLPMRIVAADHLMHIYGQPHPPRPDRSAKQEPTLTIRIPEGHA